MFYSSSLYNRELFLENTLFDLILFDLKPNKIILELVLK